MAGKSSILSVTVLMQTAKLKQGVKDSQRELKGLASSVKGIGSKINGAFAAIGIGIGINGLKQMAKAAMEDNRAQIVLAKSMRNATKANAGQIKSAEDYISALQIQTGILDDDLRPAFATIYRTTKDLTAAQHLLSVSTDVAAGTGKDLGMVSQAIAKAYTGQFASLNKLIPGINKAKNPLKELETSFKGIASQAAKSDPFAVLGIIFNDLAETIGNKILPYVQTFAEYLASPEGSARLDAVIGQLTTIADLTTKATIGIADFFAAGKDDTWDGGFWSFFPAWWNGFKNDLANLDKLTAIKNNQQISGSERAAMPTVSTPADLKFDLTKKLPGITTSLGGGKVKNIIADNKAIMKSAVETLKTSLADVRTVLKEFSDKFRNAVDLSFGVVQRGLGKAFNVNRFVNEMKRVKSATADLNSNLDILRKTGGKAGNSLIESIIGLPPEEAAAVARGFAGNLDSFKEAIKIGGGLASTGTGVGKVANSLAGNQTQEQILDEIKILNKELKTGKNTYNIKSDMTATEIVNAIKKWERSTGRKVLAG